MISAFFIRRPILTTVVSITIVLAGLGAMLALPVAQYPNILPTQISVSAMYAGASAEVAAQTVAAPLERQINGASDMLYMSSTSTSSGSVTLNVTFETGTDPDEALIEVNNRVQATLATLPEEVRRIGVNSQQANAGFLAVAALLAPEARYDEFYLSNYALVNIIDELRRVPGVGNAQLFSSKYYAMRVWLDPARMSVLGVTPMDVARALREQSTQLPAGRIGGEPLERPVDFSFTMTTRGRLATPEAFGQVVIRREASGALLRVRDIARVELGGQDYNFTAKLNGSVAAPFAIFLQPGANAIDTMDGVMARLKELSTQFPAGLEYQIPYDTTKFVRISIAEVVETLFIAFALVFIVVYVFLGNWRATLIPSVVVPVSLIGTFAAMHALDFSINTLTLFGMVLAIGIVVDDAIVVLENVMRIMHEEHLPAAEATLKAMQQVSGPVIAIVLVLAAVFMPMAFLGGLSGVMYQQFAITIAVSVAISGFVALTLTPALCALFLSREDKATFSWIETFDAWFGRVTGRYTSAAARLMRHGVLTLGLFLAGVVMTLLMFHSVPSVLLPDEDQGFVIAAATLPDGASLSRTSRVMEQLDEFGSRHPLVARTMSLTGFDMLSNSLKSNGGVQILELADWSERPDPDQSAAALAQQITNFGMGVRDAFVFGLNLPPIIGLSTTGGFEFYVESRANADYGRLAEVTREIVARAASEPTLISVQTTFSAGSPQIRMEIDRDKAAQMGVSPTALFETTQAIFGGLYVNDFDREGRTFHVIVQAQGDARDTIEDLRNVNVRAASGALVPLTALVTPVQDVGAEVVERFNNFPAIKVLGNPAPGISSGEAMHTIERLAGDVLPQGYTIAWTGSSYQEKHAGSAAAIAFGAGILMVFFILAALYERWSLPIAVVLSVPFAIFGAFLAVLLRGLGNDIYLQVGLVTLIGLSAKNAILIVEFAAENVRDGMESTQAALHAMRQRFRPIIMTSLAFVVGVLPLAIGTGAGSAARHSIATGVIGGTLVSTLIGVLFVPTFFHWVSRRRVHHAPPQISEPVTQRQS